MAARHSSSAKLPVCEELVITQVLDASREAVWEAWTDPRRFMLWWGPKGFISPACEIDLRVGGKFLACMRSPEGQDYWSTGVYREIVPNVKIVYTDNFSDAKGNVVPASHYGLRGDWSSEMLVTVTFEEAGSKTIMTLRHVGIPPEMIGDCEAGWSGSFDKLAGIL